MNLVIHDSEDIGTFGICDKGMHVVYNSFLIYIG